MGGAVQPGWPGEPSALAVLAAGAGTARPGDLPAAVPALAAAARSWLCAGENARRARGGICGLAAWQPQVAGVRPGQRLAVRRAAARNRRRGWLARARRDRAVHTPAPQRADRGREPVLAGISWVCADPRAQPRSLASRARRREGDG